MGMMEEGMMRREGEKQERKDEEVGKIIDYRYHDLAYMDLR